MLQVVLGYVDLGYVEEAKAAIRNIDQVLGQPIVPWPNKSIKLDTGHVLSFEALPDNSVYLEIATPSDCRHAMALPLETARRLGEALLMYADLAGLAAVNADLKKHVLRSGPQVLQST